MLDLEFEFEHFQFGYFAFYFVFKLIRKCGLDSLEKFWEKFSI
jgi:hypothetical protein